MQHWAENEPAVLRRLLRVIRACLQEPFTGPGKPEPLKHDLSGYWSRRLTEEHRIVYRVTDEWIEFVQARFHY